MAQSFINPNKSASAISAAYKRNPKAMGAQKVAVGNGKMMPNSTYQKAVTHPFNPLAPNSKFVVPKGASPKVLAQYSRIKAK